MSAERAEAAAWRRLVIAVLGGDEREQEICRRAAATGAEVRAFGFPWPQDGLDGVRAAHDAAISSSAVPMQGCVARPPRSAFVCMSTKAMRSSCDSGRPRSSKA